jgi:uncharacterized protein YjbI with pentapeptide repeats
MARDRRPTALRHILTRRTGWALALVLAILGILLGAQPLARAADVAGQALGDVGQLVLDAGWLLLLLSAAGLAASLHFSSPQGRATTGWLRRRLTTRPVLVGAATAGLLMMLVLVVVVVPPRFTADRQFKTASEELKAQSDVRTTLLQGFAALLVLTGAAIGASVTLRQVRATRDQIAKTAEASSKEQELIREGQITDRYTKAVDQLGSDHLDVRLGGIYALQRIARDSPPDEGTVEEVLTAYLRGHAPWPPPPTPPSLQAITRRLVTFAQQQRWALQRRTAKAKATAGQEQQGRPDEKAPQPQGLAADVRAAATVLGRRRLPSNVLRALDLTGVDLRLAYFDDANLAGTSLIGANLQAAQFNGANLHLVRLNGANLEGAWLNGANLHLAQLNGANLQGSLLNGANLQHAWLNGANLKGADLRRARMQAAMLSGANLEDARLDEADLNFARADRRTRWPDGWDRATAEARGVQYRD